ncbi:hypothetical protein [Deinococcus sp. YIM 77859]|uniref:hypothetical protein n=1 Tax=Deinococcus sp. YIM 77859 TaxID=1540221 RepID=UPI00054EB306|nr:hypothetical protein [Deinococcus sp. YIM 77859]
MSDPFRDGKPDHAPADGTQVNELTGQPDHRTGYQMPDPKDVHEAHYTTTPLEDRVASADQGKAQPPEPQDPREITGQFDHLATRDPEAMAHAPQEAEFAGAQTVEGLGFDRRTVDGLAVANLDVTASLATTAARRNEAIDPNPDYVPPSQKVVPHVPEQPGDLPPGVPAELKAEVEGTEDDERLV